MAASLDGFWEGGHVLGSSDGKAVLICKSHAGYPLDRVIAECHEIQGNWQEHPCLCGG